MPTRSLSQRARSATHDRRTSRNAHAGRKQRHTEAHASRSKKAASTTSSKRWSHHVMETSDAMDVQHDIFKSGTPDEIAASLKQSARRSKRRKGTPFQSAMSMLNFYINRAGRNLSKTRRTELDRAKHKLREAFGRPPARGQR